MFHLNKKVKRNRGMTYVELIVVLAIFSVMTSVILFNYGTFQTRVDIKNLGSDVALKLVEAQKSALSGLLPQSAKQGQIDSTWKPSYGLYINPSASIDTDSPVGIAFNKKFIYFVDLNNISNAPNSQNGLFDGSTSSCNGECLDKISITKGNYISALTICPNTNCSGVGVAPITNPISITFKRPNSGVIFKDSLTTSLLSVPGAGYVRITIISPDLKNTAFIKIYLSGRIQVQ